MSHNPFQVATIFSKEGEPIGTAEVLSNIDETTNRRIAFGFAIYLTGSTLSAPQFLALITKPGSSPTPESVVDDGISIQVTIPEGAISLAVQSDDMTGIKAGEMIIMGGHFVDSAIASYLAVLSQQRVSESEIERVVGIVKQKMAENR
jgi:hypothetical protein